MSPCCPVCCRACCDGLLFFCLLPGGSFPPVFGCVHTAAAVQPAVQPLFYLSSDRSSAALLLAILKWQSFKAALRTGWSALLTRRLVCVLNPCAGSTWMQHAASCVCTGCGIRLQLAVLALFGLR